MVWAKAIQSPALISALRFCSLQHYCWQEPMHCGLLQIKQWEGATKVCCLMWWCFHPDNFLRFLKGDGGGGCPSSVSSVSLRTLLPEVDSTSEVKIDETESRDYPPKSHGLSPKRMLFYGYPPVSDTPHITPWSSCRCWWSLDTSIAWNNALHMDCMGGVLQLSTACDCNRMLVHRQV